MSDNSTMHDQTDSAYVETYVEVPDGRRRVAVLAAILVLLILLLAAILPLLYSAVRPPGAPTAAETGEGLQWIRSIYGWGNTEAERLVAPVGVAVAPDGTYWTVSNHRIMAGFDSRGRLAQMIRLPEGEEFGQILSIEGITFDEGGNMYVVDYGNAKIIKLDPDGEVDGEVFVAYPQKVAARDGIVAVAAIPGVAVFDGETGDLISQWGGRGTGPEHFDGARGIAIGADGTVFVSDAHNKRVKAYEQDGTLLWAFPEQDVAMAAREAAGPQGTPMAAPEEFPFQLPSGLTIDGAGRLVLVDPFNFEIIALDPADGSIVDRWGEVGSGDGQFGYPSDIAYDAALDYFVVSDTANDRLQVVALDGSGGGVGATLARATSTPIWICCLPLFLLLALVVAAVMRRRREREIDKETSPGEPVQATP